MADIRTRAATKQCLWTTLIKISINFISLWK